MALPFAWSAPRPTRRKPAPVSLNESRLLRLIAHGRLVRTFIGGGLQYRVSGTVVPGETRRAVDQGPGAVARRSRPQPRGAARRGGRTMSDTPLTQHPLSAVFPAMTDVAFAEFRADIAQNGLRQPIIVFEDQILEGWHRYRACRDTGTPARFEHFDGDEAAARKFVVSANVMRRHLDESQRGLIAARMAQLPHGGDRKSDQRTNSSLDIAGAAELLNVGTSTVKDARTVLASGDAETIAAVEQGKLSVSRAAKEVRQSTPQTRPQPKAKNDQPSKPALVIEPKTVEQWAVMPEADRQIYCSHRDPKASLNPREGRRGRQRHRLGQVDVEPDHRVSTQLSLLLCARHLGAVRRHRCFPERFRADIPRRSAGGTAQCPAPEQR